MEQLKRLRSEKRLSQAKLAARAGLDPSTVNQIERGVREASPPTLRKLADALDVNIADLLESEAPKVQAPLHEPEEQQRRDVYTPWLEFINNYADRWEAKIAQGAFDRGAESEFLAIMEDLSPILSRLGLQEKQEQPPGYIYTFGPTIDKAVTRIDELLTPLIEAGYKQDEESDLARLRRRREELVSDQDQAAHG